MMPTVKAPHTVSVLAPAKINLGFDILRQRSDGYHEIITLFQSVSLHDTLTFRFFETEAEAPASNSKTITINISLSRASAAVDIEHFPLDKKNSISRAIEVFLSKLSYKSSITIEVEVEKKIPIGAGLAGGSTNAAATLVALNSYFDNLCTYEQLIQLSAQIGSDVAFCLMGGSAIGKGRGEQLVSTDLHLNKYFILVKPRSVFVSTPWAYKAYDQAMSIINRTNVDNQKLIESRIENVLKNIKITKNVEPDSRGSNTPLFWNAFEPIIFKEYPLLAEIKERLLNLGCLEAHLTGSGPTICGLVKSKEDGEKILHSILDRGTANENKVVLDAWLTETIDHGIQILPLN